MPKPETGEDRRKAGSGVGDELHPHGESRPFWHRELREARCVGGHRNVLEPKRAEEAHHADEVLVEERLAAGQPNTTDPGCDEAAHHRLPRPEVELLVEVAVLLVGAAVDAGEVAPIGERKTYRPWRRRCAGRSALQDGKGVNRQDLSGNQQNAGAHQVYEREGRRFRGTDAGRPLGDWSFS